MSVTSDDALDELRKVARTGLAGTWYEPSSGSGWLEASEYSRGQWRRMTHELDVLRLGVPSRFGGIGFGLSELGVFFEEAGRVLLGAPLLSNVLAIQALLESHDDQSAPELVRSICSGDVNCALAWLAVNGQDPAPLRIEGQRVHGTAGFVIDASSADVLLALAEGSLWAVDAGDAGVVIHREPFFDLTRSIATVRFEGAHGQRVGQAGIGDRLIEVVCLRGTALLAAEQLGGATAAMDSAIAYSMSRWQFGRPIGANQAIKHRLADLFVKVEAARSAVTYALEAADRRPWELLLAASIAKVVASEAFLAAAGENLQVHGAMGFTFEHQAHLFLRRALADDLLFGSPDQHRDRLANEVLDSVDATGRLSLSSWEAQDSFGDEVPLDFG